MHMIIVDIMIVVNILQPSGSVLICNELNPHTVLNIIMYSIS